MNRHKDSPLGVCVLPEPAPNLPRTVRYSHYVTEILDHAGIYYELLDHEPLDEYLDHLKVLVTVGEGVFPESSIQKLKDWVECGGAWIGVGGTCGGDDLFGVEVLPPTWSLGKIKSGTLGEGYLQPLNETHKTLEHLAIPLHFFGGMPVRANGAEELASVLDAHYRPTNRSALTINRAGDGVCMLLAPDLTGTVCRIQQGIGMTRDGVSAPDGTASIEDRVGKTDDGAVLDWLQDRQPVDDVEGFSAFLQPIADQWRELFLRSIFHVCTLHNISLPLIWLYPRALPALGEISHDTDLCEAPKALSMMKVVESAGIHTTWCVILPGYPSEIIDAIKAAGHELATHYDAMTAGCEWGEREFTDTVSKLTEMFGDSKPITNKNHYLRWEGDTEFFDWCVKNGIEIDQSKGPSKSGNVGFGFGTCHPYFPVDPDGKLIDVLELPTLTQDILIVAPRELSAYLAAGAAKHHGIMHLLFHPAHIEKPGVADALTEAINLGKDQGMEFWTARNINNWERARRSIKWQGWESTAAGARCCLSASREMKQATIMWLSGDKRTITIDGNQQNAKVLERWGFRFAATDFDISPGTTYLAEITE